jgi:Cytochrome oxidase complex assembly protein 1
MPDATVPPPLPRPNWLARNWKWLVPSGCLFVFLMMIGFAAGVFFLATGMMKQSDVYKIAVARAREHPAVIEALGTPISEGWMASGSTHVAGPGGEASLAIPIHGPKGKATIYVEAIKAANIWHFNTLAVEIDATKKRIDLNAAAQ